MMLPGADAPQTPSAAAGAQILSRNGTILTLCRSSAGHGKHRHVRLRKERTEVASTAAGDVRFEILVSMDGDLPTVVLPARYSCETVVTAEISPGLPGQDSPQQGIL